MVEGGDENKIVVIDAGSRTMKAGFAGEEAPECVFRNVIGHVKGDQEEPDKTYIGDEAIQNRNKIIGMGSPVQAGIIGSCESYEQVLHHTFYNELKVFPNEIKGVLFAEAPRVPKTNREKLVQIMFETFEVENIYVAINAVMCLYSAGRTTGLSIDCGDSVVDSVPVIEGFSLPHAVERSFEITGSGISKHLMKLLQDEGHKYSSQTELEIINKMKEEVCYVAQDFAAENEQCGKNAEKHKEYSIPYDDYYLPDNEKITVPGSIRIGAPEIMFTTTNNTSDQTLQALAWASVSASDIDIRKELCKNIILSGGSSMYEGMADRLKQELVNKAPYSGTDIRIIAPADRNYSIWKGVSTLASLSTFESSWVNKEDYEEQGAAVIHRKCN